MTDNTGGAGEKHARLRYVVGPKSDISHLPVYIYALVDPRDETVRYVGQTWSLSQRKYEHQTSHKTHNERMIGWQQELSALGLKFEMHVIARAAEADADDAERYWIAFYRSIGALYNEQGGGGRGRHVTRPEPVRADIVRMPLVKHGG